MSIGIPVSKESVDVSAGNMALNLERALNDAVELKLYFDRFTAAEISTMFGYTEQEANVLKSALGEADVIRQAWVANRTFLQQLAGLGDV
jgi:hypothetical protein